MSQKILIADDSPTIQKVVELTFMEEDFEVVAVSGGDEAISRFQEVNPQVVIADIHMPGASGIEVCRRVKELSSEVPVLLLVGTFEPFDQAEFDSSGADGVLKKPFDSQELFRRVEDLLAGMPSAPVTTAGEAEEGESSSPEEEEAIAGLASDETLDEVGLTADSEGLFPDAPAGGEAAEPSVYAADAEQATGSATVFAGLELEADVEQQAEEVPAPLPEQDELAEQAASDLPQEAAGHAPLSEDDVDRIARRVVELLSDEALREVAWEVVPDIAEVVVRERLRELESEVE